MLHTGVQTLDLSYTAQAPPLLRRTFAALNRAIELQITEATLAARSVCDGFVHVLPVQARLVRFAMSVRIVAPFGFYGAGNTGDEGTLCGFARLLTLRQVQADVSIASRNPAHCAQVEPSFRYFKNPGGVRGIDPRRWWAMFRGSMHAVIGGTPIMDVLGDWPLSSLAPIVRASGRRKVPFVFVGCGVEGLKSERSRRIVRDDIAPFVRRWTVRSGRDRDRLLEYGVPPDAVSAAADMAWLLEPVPIETAMVRLNQWGVDTDGPVIGVSVVNENACFDRFPGMTAAVAGALDRFIEEYDAYVLFVCAEMRAGPIYDAGAARHIMARMKRADRAVMAPNYYLSPQELMSIIGCCTFTISMRYHVCLFSALQGVPFVAIERADKVADLCGELGWSARVVPPHLDLGEIVDHGHRLTEDRRITDDLGSQVEVLRNRALLNAAALDVSVV